MSLCCLFRMLVGAPKGKNLQPGTNHSGSLFKCPITAKTNDCVQVITDGRRCKWFQFNSTLLLLFLNLKQIGGERERNQEQWVSYSGHLF